MKAISQLNRAEMAALAVETLATAGIGVLLVGGSCVRLHQLTVCFVRPGIHGPDFRKQLHNDRNLDSALVMTYESLVQNPARVCQQLETFVPQLGALDHTASFKVDSIDGPLNRPITDLNAKKIAALSADTIAAMNKIFVQHRETLTAWGYELVAPS